MIHDEMVWEIRKEDLPRAREIVSSTLQNSEALSAGKVKFLVPFPVKISTGSKWSAMKMAD